MLAVGNARDVWDLDDISMVLDEPTCGAENALSPALVAQPLKLLCNVLHHRHSTRLAI